MKVQLSQEFITNEATEMMQDFTKGVENTIYCHSTKEEEH